MNHRTAISLLGKAVLTAITGCVLSVSAQAATPADVNLSTASEFTIFQRGGANLEMSSGILVNGNAALGPAGNQEFSANPSISGNYYTDPTATNVDPTEASIGGSHVVQDLSGAASDVNAASTALKSLDGSLGATHTLGNVNGSTTIASVGSINIVEIGSIALSSTELLTLSGGADDYFYIDVSGSGDFSASSGIQLNGVDIAHVIFVWGGDLQQSGDSTLRGTHLVDGEYSSDGNLIGMVMAQGKLDLHSGGMVRAAHFAPVPLPASLPLFLSGLAGMAWLRRRNRQA